MKVINIDFENKTFETDEGVIYPLVFNVENSITLDEFQELLNESEDVLMNLING